MAVRKSNMTIDPDIYDRFIAIAGKKGIKTSTWVTAKMKEFVEQEEAAEKAKQATR